MLLFVVTLVGAKNFDLQRELIGYEDPGSASGVNALGRPYLPTPQLDKAHDLMAEINAAAGSNVVVSIARFLRASDTLVVYNGSSVNTDFDLFPGEGYRVKLSGETTTYPMLGSHDTAFAMTLYGPGEDLPVPEGTSNSGMNDYAPPYNRVAETASDVMQEINDLGTIACTDGGGTCVREICSGGSWNFKDCTPFMSISRFLIETDTLTTYAGVDGDDNFALVAGESYRVQVSEGVALVPEVYDVEPVVEIEDRPPSPCATVHDGGVVRLYNHGTDYVRLQWHGGDPYYANETPAIYTNLVFLPDKGPTDCGTDNNPAWQGCAQTCPGPQESQPGGCEREDACDTCGCEILSSVTGYCNKSGLDRFVPCLTAEDCEGADPPITPPVTCVRKGDLGPDASDLLQCNQVTCAPQLYCPDLYCDPEDLLVCYGTCCGGLPHDYPADTNCCDQPEDYCEDPTKIQCTVVAGYDFSIMAWSEDGTDWADFPSDRGIVLQVTETNCCEFVCRNAQGEIGDPCPDGECGESETCASPCTLP